MQPDTQLTIEQLLDLGPFSWAALLCCAINGILVGVERQTRGKPVGIRTSILVISGTYFFMSMAVSLSPNTLDQARVLGQIITGVGFLGAGVMMTLDGKIHGGDVSGSHLGACSVRYDDWLRLPATIGRDYCVDLNGITGRRQSRESH